MVWLRGSFSAIMTELYHNFVVTESRSRHVFRWRLFFLKFNFYGYLFLFFLVTRIVDVNQPQAILYVFLYTVSFLSLSTLNKLINKSINKVYSFGILRKFQYQLMILQLLFIIWKYFSYRFTQKQFCFVKIHYIVFISMF